MHKQPHNYGSMATTEDVHFEGTSSSSQFNSICDSVVTNIYTISSSCKTLENALKSIGTSRDNQGLRDKIHVTQLSTNQIIAATPRDLSRLKMRIQRGDKQKELQINKLLDNFTAAINKYYLLQKEIANKIKASLLVSASEEASSNDPGVQEQVQLFHELAFEQDMLVDREARITEIESGIMDINQIMRELSVIAHKQGETLDTIENSIDYATNHIEDGASELAKAEQYQRKSRRKLCFLVLLAIVILSVLIVILVSTIKR